MNRSAHMLAAITILIAAGGLGGCGGKPAAKPAARPSAPVARAPDVENPEKPAEAPVKPAGDGQNPTAVTPAETPQDAVVPGVGAPDKSAAPESGGESEPDTPATPDGDGELAGAGTRERFVVFAPRGPLLVEVSATIDGRPYDAAMRQLVDKVLRDADTNGDGVPSWDEVLASPKFKYGQYGNMAVNTAADEREMRRQYDIDNDNRLDAGEVPRFLTQNAGRTRTFTLTSSNAHRGDNQSRSPVRLVLDHDGDGRVDADEIGRAALRLRLYDSDGDDILVLDDFKARTNLNPATPAMSRRRYGPDTAVLISQSPKWRDLAYSMSELYGFGGALQRDSIPLVPQLFEALDGDADGKLATEELEALLTVPAHISIAVHFGQRADGGTAPLVLQNLGLDFADFTDVATERSGRISIDLGDCDLLFYYNDLVGGQDYQVQAAGQLEAFDGDGNGYIDRKEFTEEAMAVLFSFEALDADSDGAIRRDELATFLAQRQAALVSQLEVRAADQEDALFNALDANDDARLTTREIDDAPQRLVAFDRNGDGQLAPHEIPGSIAVGFLRGSRADALEFGVPAVAPAATDSTGPDWFRSMDENADGELSAREFFGSAELFSELDRNGDGILSPQELEPGSR